MARVSKQTRRPATGSQRTTAGSRPGAARPRQAPPQRRKKKQGFSANRVGWLAVGLVVVIIAGLIVYKTTNHSPASSSNGVASGQHPLAASAAVVAQVTSVQTSVLDRVGTNGQPAAFTVTANQPP